jgi:tRNA uridine 5-carbamoylmethylation protein Kti12
MVTLYIIRGLPGTGKSTLGKTLAGKQSFAADDHFMVDGEYKFDPSKLGEAHNQCARNVKNALLDGEAAIRSGVTSFSVAVCNTFSCRWEYEPYIEMAKELGVRYFVINLFDNDTPLETLFERNVHGVPRHVFKSMYDRWET